MVIDRLKQGKWKFSRYWHTNTNWLLTVLYGRKIWNLNKNQIIAKWMLESRFEAREYSKIEHYGT